MSKIPGSMVARTEPELYEAVAQVPPGRTLASEYLRQRRVITEQQKQIVRAIELRIAADQRAGERNVRALEERIEALEEQRAILIDALKAAPWGSCRGLSEAVGTALNDNEASDENGSEIENEIGVSLKPSRFQEGTIVKVTTEGHPEPRLGKIVAIDSSRFCMFEVEILATRERKHCAGVSLEPVS